MSTYLPVLVASMYERIMCNGANTHEHTKRPLPACCSDQPLIPAVAETKQTPTRVTTKKKVYLFWLGMLLGSSVRVELFVLTFKILLIILEWLQPRTSAWHE